MIAKLSLFMVILSISVNARPEADSKILRYENNLGQNEYTFSFITDYGIVRSEKGVFQPISETQGLAKIEGYSEHRFPENLRFSLTYEADENGYRPKFNIGPNVGSVPTAAIASITGAGLGK